MTVGAGGVATDCCAAQLVERAMHSLRHQEQMIERLIHAANNQAMHYMGDDDAVRRRIDKERIRLAGELEMVQWLMARIG